MKALVVGGGSIGARHLRNLRALGVVQLGLVETDAGRRNALGAELEIEQFSDLEAGLDWVPSFVVIATPTHLHMQQALQVAQRGFDVFVEKPLSHTADGLAELAEIVDCKKLISMVGCNMRFHPGPAKVKELIEQKTLGRVFFGRLHVGSYLPDWRKGSDYRGNYAARNQTGGGCILDCIHEIDLARWHLGEVNEVLCMTQTTGALEIETEDVAALIFRHAGGATSEVHLDYVQRTYERGCQIVGEHGSIFWDYNAGQVRWFNARTNEWKTFGQTDGWEANAMYVAEMKHFLDCVQDRRATCLPISEAVSVTQIALAAKESAAEGKLANVSREVLA